ncbi:unnamed protein product [Rhizophagus irregularis]|nr:unnamed protein product [Rhizophagus irregularis]
MKRVLSDQTNLQESKKIKHPEALQELYRLQPSFNGKQVYFFYKKAKYKEGTLIYDKKDKTFYVFDKKSGEKFDTFSSWISFLKTKKVFKGARSAIATVFFEPNSSGSSLASILRTTEQIPYWKVNNSASIVEVTSLVKTNITSKKEFFGVGIREIVNGIGITFFGKECKVEKNLTIRWHDNLISYDMNVFEKSVKKIDGIETGIAIERNLFEINKMVEFVSKAKLCPGQITKDFEQVVKLRGVNLVNNQKNSNNIHEVFATLENQEIEILLVPYLQKSTKISHASQEILANKVQLQRKKISKQNQIINILQDRLQQKVEDEKEAVSDDLGQIAQEIANRVTKNEIDISSFSPIFQELIRIQCNQATKGIRYHPMFLRWAISVYSRGGKTAYESMKSIMRLPSISTLKSYINENQQQSGWQNKTAYQILQKMTVENISIHGRTGFLSHDSFKIQKGLLWSQRDNRYVGYLDFEDEKKELQSFMMKCEKELQEELQIENLPNSIYSDCERGIATQVHQIIWHSATCKFAYPIAYYGINTLTAHEINKILFQLAANLECLGIHTCGSICDGAGENRNHIKSFDWWASFWYLGDIVEVNIGKNNYEKAKIMATNLDHSKFTVRLLDLFFPDEFQVNRNLLRQPMPNKSDWKINDSCEFKNPEDNKWHWQSLQILINHRHFLLQFYPLKGVEDVKNAMEMIDELKEISAGTREFINYSYLYRQIFHSKKPLENLADSRLQTLKEIRDWFVIRDNQKTSTMNWISPQCQFDLLLSIQGFLDMICWKDYLATIRQLGGDSSTQTLKGYGYALNKFQITSLVTAKMKSVNYGTSNHTEMDLDYLSQYDYRKKSTKNNDIHSNLLDHAKHLSNMSSFIQRIFKAKSKNFTFQVERQQLFNLLIYNNEIISLLERWKNDIKNIILKSMPKRKGNLWTTTWISHLETCLNNYLCSGIWFQQFQEIIIPHSQSSLMTKRLVAYKDGAANM